MRFFPVTLISLSACFSTKLFSEGQAGCPPGLPKDRISSDIAAVYKGTPFKEGEISTYKVHYMGILVGYGHIQVKAPVHYQNEWLQHFSAWASTGDWYKAFFVAKDRVMAYSRPATFAVRKFYIKQDEGKMFGNRFIQEKWLNFDQGRCLVDEIIKKKDKPVVREKAELSRDSIDALGAVFKLRSMTFKVGETKRIPVYSSRKNWWLDASPVKTEEVDVPAGSFSAIKLKLQTYLGKDLQQKGDVYAWIAQNHPFRPLIKVEGEIKIGSVEMELEKLTVPGPELQSEKAKQLSGKKKDVKKTSSKTFEN